MSPSVANNLATTTASSIVASVSQGAGALLSAAFDLLDYEGVVTVVQNFGALTGSTTVPVLTMSDTSGGTYSALATTGAFGTTANGVTAVSFSASEALRFIKYGCTITTGPILMSVTIIGHKKYR